jgi:hypothetical protein
MIFFIQQLFGFTSSKDTENVEAAISDGFETDEDRQMDRLAVHRDCIGWLMAKLESHGIRCERTTGNSSKGDLRLCNPADVHKAREVIREMQSKYNSSK